LHRVQSLLRPAVAVTCLALLLWLVDWRSSIELLARISPGPVAVACLASALGIVISAWKWQLLLRALHICASLPTLVRVYWIGGFVSSFLPSSVGGDLARTALTRHLGGIGPVGASILVERVTGFAVLLVLALGAVLTRPDLPTYRPLWMTVVVGIAASAGVIVALVVSLVARSRRLTVSPPSGHSGWAKRARKVLATLELGLVQYTRRRGAVAVACAVSLPFYALHVVFHVAVFRAFGLDVPLIDIMAIMPLVGLVSALPVSLRARPRMK
jgi:uncharacterized protein (TIRG00374 family)